ncbi:MAG: uracil-DNA glycosylase, partial [Candidatus Thermoplasmatota archaeon]
MAEGGLPVLRVVADAVRACQLCPLGAGRIHAVPGEGTGRNGVMLVGEAPGRKEDESGRPFVGSAGKNLDLALREAGIERAACFITSVVKCRPPENRDPTEGEKAACRPYLERQVAALAPKVIVALGRHGLSGLIGHVPPEFAKLRGTFLAGPQGIPIFVSLHPAAVIYRQKWKEQYLQDWREFGAWLRGEGPAGFGPDGAAGACNKTTGPSRVSRSSVQ